MLPPASTLYSTDPGLRHIALLAGVAESAAMRLELDAMERVFSRLAAVIEGKPATREGGTASLDFHHSGRHSDL